MRLRIRTLLLTVALLWCLTSTASACCFCPLLDPFHWLFGCGGYGYGGCGGYGYGGYRHGGWGHAGGAGHYGYGGAYGTGGYGYSGAYGPAGGYGYSSPYTPYAPQYPSLYAPAAPAVPLAAPCPFPIPIPLPIPVIRPIPIRIPLPIPIPAPCPLPFPVPAPAPMVYNPSWNPYANQYADPCFPPPMVHGPAGPGPFGFSGGYGGYSGQPLWNQPPIGPYGPQNTGGFPTAMGSSPFTSFSMEADCAGGYAMPQMGYPANSIESGCGHPGCADPGGLIPQDGTPDVPPSSMNFPGAIRATPTVTLSARPSSVWSPTMAYNPGAARGNVLPSSPQFVQQTSFGTPVWSSAQITPGAYGHTNGTFMRQPVPSSGINPGIYYPGAPYSRENQQTGFPIIRASMSRPLSTTSARAYPGVLQ